MLFRMFPERPLQGKATVLVTGASSGIGDELAKLFARDGYRLVLVARDAAKLTAVAQELRQRYSADAVVLSKDLALPASPDELLGELRARAMPVDVLVNNAGFGSHGLFAESDLPEQLRMIQVNVTALTHLTRVLLPGMLERGWGRILNVASTAAFQAGPLMSVYYASKAYVLSFSEAVANEVRGTGVAVTVLCPGPTLTDFQRRAGLEATPLMGGRVMDAATVALAGYRGLMDNKTVVIPGFRNRLVALAVRALPRDVVTAAVRRIQEKRPQPHNADTSER